MANFMNDYSLEIIRGKNKDRYFVSFTDGYGEFQRLEINEDIYFALFELNKRDRNLTRSDERNIEHSELTDETLIRRAFEKPKCIEEIILEKEMKKLFWKAIGELSGVQRKRLLLYYDCGLTLKEIAKMENCSIRAIKYSIDIAKKKLEEKIKKF
ncbi:RNA polymerase sigma-70 factor, ECF subfamily [Tissierella praeacuta DSM 18095]|uniref:RNA polymerase sigma-70 factor, ECF subfamily n=1 Tax=Tissierella praeacuta DSM 18095 TaxID=1123404 RepID=A0A1M4X9R5_9FIRM|nr:sigma factor-like helix-turn-helix DNA-binding protein [Tissierella praeacuta]SHE90224.1 RNA polymerase sigma-70 factor, ECF subfamily [Tissierella praeacuta DSM 18095]SUP02555.1 RNA polymerase sigma factor [Tissierella praeacuta]